MPQGPCWQSSHLYEVGTETTTNLSWAAERHVWHERCPEPSWNTGSLACMNFLTKGLAEFKDSLVYSRCYLWAPSEIMRMRASMWVWDLQLWMELLHFRWVPGTAVHSLTFLFNPSKTLHLFILEDSPCVCVQIQGCARVQTEAHECRYQCLVQRHMHATEKQACVQIYILSPHQPISYFFLTCSSTL